MITRDQIVECARTYLGVPFHHQGRAKNAGIDCIGLIVGIAKELNIFEYDNVTYHKHTNGILLLKEVQKMLISISLDEKKPGDVVLSWFDPRTKHPQHMGVLTSTGVIHTYDRVNKVVETRLGSSWDSRMIYAFRFPGVEE